MDYILSQRGRPLIVVDGFLYRKNRGAYWRCIRCTKFKCKSRLILRPDRDPVCVEKHSHGPEKEKIEWGRKVKKTSTMESSPPNRKSGTQSKERFQTDSIRIVYTSDN